MTAKFCDSFRDVLQFHNEAGLSDIFFGQTQQLQSMCQITDVIQFLKASESVSFPSLSIDVLNFVSLPKVFKIVALDQEDIVFLMASYRTMFPFASLNVDDIGEIVKKFGYVTILGENFGSRHLHRKLRSSDILACWNTDPGENIDHPTMDLRPCRVDFYFSHTAKIQGNCVTNIFAKVSWYKEFSERYKYGNALQMWHCDKFEANGQNCFLPVQKIHSRFSKGITGESKDLMCVCPIPRRILSDNDE